jgi:hypothetical protein
MKRRFSLFLMMIIMAIATQTAFAQEAAGKHLIVYAYMNSNEASVDSGEKKKTLITFDSLAKLMDEYAVKGYQLVQTGSYTQFVGKEALPIVFLVFEKK